MAHINVFMMIAFYCIVKLFSLGQGNWLVGSVLLFGSLFLATGFHATLLDANC